MRRPLTLVVVIALSSVLGCENPSPRALRRAPVPVPMPVAQVELSLAKVPGPGFGPIQWDATKSEFSTHGQPLRAEKLWTFDGTTDGFVATNGVATPSADSGLEVAETERDVVVRSPKGLQINGRTRSLVILRITRTQAGAAWDGAIYYSTAGHGEDQRFFAKPISGGNPRLNETVLIVYDMHRLSAGADDWKDSVIDQLRIDLDDIAGGAFTIHQVAVANDPGNLFDTDNPALQIKPVEPRSADPVPPQTQPVRQ